MFQWITEDYNYVSPKSIPDDLIIGLRINDVDYDNGSDGQLCILTQELQGFNANDLPVNLEIIPCDSFNDFGINSSYYIDTLLFDGKNITCTYIFSIEKNAHTGLYKQSDLLAFERIRINANNSSYKTFISDYNDSKYLYFSAIFSASKPIEQVLCEIAIISEKIFSNIIVSPLFPAATLNGLSEKVFTNEYVIPTLKKLNYLGISYNHGISEFGKDIIYHRLNDFSQLIYGAVQVKAGDLSGRANSKLYEISNQIEIAFATPFKDLSTRSDIFISECLVICSGGYTNNAKEIIAGKFKGRSVSFIDGNTIIDILNR